MIVGRSRSPLRSIRNIARFAARHRCRVRDLSWGSAFRRRRFGLSGSGRSVPPPRMARRHARRYLAFGNGRPRTRPPGRSPSEIMAHCESRTEPIRPQCNSLGVWRLLSTFDEHDAGYRSAPASPPAGFGYPHDSLLIVILPDRCRPGALARLCPPECSPSVDRYPFPDPDPLAVGCIVATSAETVAVQCSSASGLCSRRRSVGVLTPRYSPGLSVLQGFQSRRPPSTSRPRGSPMCFPQPPPGR
jgi:hypothetical protein